MTDVDDILGVKRSPQAVARRSGARPALDAPPPPLKRRPVRRLYVNALRARNAAEALAGLPAAGETWHTVMTANFDSFDLIDAMLTHAAPDTIDAMHLASLGFNHANASRLLAMLGTGLVRRCTMLVSAYFQADAKEQETCSRLARELPAYGGWYCATRTHAKVIAARFSGGRCFTIESSANLRTCHNIEQFTITHDQALFDFHSQWMETVYANERDRARKTDPADGLRAVG